MAFHRLPWRDFDAFARMTGDRAMVRRLRGAERSRRKLLLYALIEDAAKAPEHLGPLPSIETVWELLARVEEASPVAFDRLLDHPYTGAWAGYTTRLLRNGLDGVGPLWIHLGHVHAIAAAAAIRAAKAAILAANEEDMRAAENLMIKDLSLAGAGLPVGGIATSTGPGTFPTKIGCDQTSCYLPGAAPVGIPLPNNHLYWLIPGAGKGPTINAVSGPTDVVTVVYADTSFPLSVYDVTLNGAAATSAWANGVMSP